MEYYRCVFSSELLDSIKKGQVYDIGKTGLPIIPVGELFQAQESMKKNDYAFQPGSFFNNVKKEIITEISGDDLESLILSDSEEIAQAFSKRISPKDSVNIISGIWFQEQFDSTDILFEIMDSLQ